IKVGRSQGINTQQLVLWNYPVAVLLTYFLLRPDFSQVEMSTLPFQLYVPLGVMLPTMFIIIALSIQYSGIVKTDMVHRVCLVVPLSASFLRLGYSLCDNTLCGVLLGFVAVLLSVSWKGGGKSVYSKALLYPLLVFCGIGGMDSLFKQVTPYNT